LQKHAAKIDFAILKAAKNPKGFFDRPAQNRIFAAGLTAPARSQNFMN